MALKIVQMSVTDLKVGMFVSRLDRPWIDTPYKIQGFLIKSEKDIEKLVQYSQSVYIDVEKSLDSSESKKEEKPLTENQKKEFLLGKKPRNYEDQTDFSGEIREATDTHKVLTKAAYNIMADISRNDKVDLPGIRKAVNPMVESIVRNPDAFSWLTQMKTKDDYTYNHSVSASIWAVALGRQLGMPKRDLQHLGMGALLFDVGKLKLPEKLINNPNIYNATEHKIVRKHVDYSVQIVSEIKGIDEKIVEMVATHHERHNGEGYPKGMKGNKIPLFGKIAGLVDCYDAITSNRSFKSAISPHDAVRKLYDWRDIDFQKELVEQFIQLIGVYPVGTVVELSDSRIAIVVAHHKLYRLRPKIMLILDKNKKPFSKFEMLDLYSTELGDNGKPLNIVKSVEPGQYGIDPRDYFI